MRTFAGIDKSENKRTVAEIEKFAKAKLKYKRTCKCGHVIYFYRKDKVLCTWCGVMVYLDEKQEFKEKLLKELKI